MLAFNGWSEEERHSDSPPHAVLFLIKSSQSATKDLEHQATAGDPGIVLREQSTV